MRALQLCLGVVFCLVLIGWSGGNKLVGTWESEGLGPNAIKGTMITFNANNTFKTKRNMMGRNTSSSGTYKLEGRTLTMTLRKRSGLAEKYQKLSDEKLAKKPSTSSMTLEWKSDREIIMVSSTGRSIMRKRV